MSCCELVIEHLQQLLELYKEYPLIAYKIKIRYNTWRMLNYKFTCNSLGNEKSNER